MARHLGPTPRPIAEIAEEVGADADSLERMMRLTAPEGLFLETAGGWVEPPLSQALRSDHPGSARPFVRLIASRSQWDAAGCLMEAARTGETAIERLFGMSAWDHYQIDREDRAVFDEAMTSKSHADMAAVKPVLDLSRFGSVADMGGGRGHLLSALLESGARYRGVVVDLPAVLAQAHERPRVTKVGANLLTDPLPPADAYILSKHPPRLQDPEAQIILRAVRAAAQPRSKLFVLETLLPATPEPHFAWTFDVIMLVANGGRERTLPDYERLFAAASFRLEEATMVDTGLSILRAGLA